MSNRSVTLNAVGDICLGDSLISLGFGVRSTLAAEGPSHLLAQVDGFLRDADFLFGNLESTLSDHGWLSDDPRTQYLRGSPQAIATLAEGGFDVLNVANNHTLQYGVEAWNETMACVSAAGIRTVGVADTSGDYHSVPIFLSKNGIRIAVVGYSYEWEQYFDGAPMYAVGHNDNVEADIIRLREKADFVVVSLHWGLEYMEFPSQDMVRLAHRLIDAGCDAIIGHHPHVMQGIEHYRDGVIAYSLGNFVFDKMWWRPCLDTAIAKFTFSLKPRRRVDLELVPLMINERYQPAPLTGSQFQAAVARQNRRDRQVSRVADATARRYRVRQKIVLQMLNFTKMLHIFRNLARYERSVRKHLILRKVLRLP